MALPRWSDDNSQIAYSDPAEDAKAVTPDDDADLPAPGTCRALYIGVSGNVEIVTPAGTTIIFNAVPVGVLSVRAKRVRAALTTATNIVALY